MSGYDVNTIQKMCNQPWYNLSPDKLFGPSFSGTDANLLEGLDIENTNLAQPHADVFGASKNAEKSHTKAYVAIGTIAAAIAGLVIFRKKLPSLEALKPTTIWNNIRDRFKGGFLETVKTESVNLYNKTVEGAQKLWTRIKGVFDKSYKDAGAGI